MRDATWNQIDQLFLKFPFACATGVPTGEIDSSESELGLRFHADYREFLTRYGGAFVGAYGIFGLRKVEDDAVDYWSVVEETLMFRAMNGPRDTYIITIDSMGAPIGILPDGRVCVFTLPESDCIASNFEEFIRRECLKLDSES